MLDIFYVVALRQYFYVKLSHDFSDSERRVRERIVVVNKSKEVATMHFDILLKDCTDIPMSYCQ